MSQYGHETKVRNEHGRSVRGKMVKKRKVGLASSETRALLLDAAEKIMTEEGYAAMTSRRIGARAGIRPQLVHYYFPTMDDLYVTLHRRRHDRMVAWATEILKSDDPLRVLWEQSSDRSHVKLTVEFMALSNHRSAVRAEALREAAVYREIQQGALTRFFELKGIEPPIPIDALIVILSGVGQLLAMQLENETGYGQENTREAIERLMADIKAARPVWSAPVDA